jgi:prepilin-type N-terminal cleavage/methylation domain-containing protein/prepilin-type processing-associated H-X9-DG protein
VPAHHDPFIQAQGSLSRRGFTLVELLVVIAIIALLISMLLPALQKARKTVLRVQCASNMRQVAIAYRFYANDHRDVIPIGYTDGVFQNTFAVSFPNYVRPPMHGWLYGSGLMRDGKVFYCPTAERGVQAYNTPENPWPPSYAGALQPHTTRIGFNVRPTVNWAPADGGQPLGPLTRMREIRNKAYIADSITSPAAVNSAHMTGVNAAFGDGSVRWVDRKVFDVVLALITTPTTSAVHNLRMLNEGVTPAGGIWGRIDRN